jgi:hypothetical protein
VAEKPAERDATMMEGFVLVLALTAIVRMARTRGASPWLYGLTAGAGGLVVAVATAAVVHVALFGPSWPPEAEVIVFDDGDPVSDFGVRLAASVSLWLWMGLVALYVRYRVGRGVASPSGSWSCPNCRSINQSYALKCDTCGEAFSSTRAS